MTNKILLIKYIQVFLFVAVYIGLGLILKLGPNLYLLAGIPLTLIFQIFIRKQPIHTLWVRNGSKFTLNKWGIMLAVAFMLYPAKKIVWMIMQNNLNIATLSCVAALVGSLGAAYSIFCFTKATVRWLLLCLATAGVLGIILFAGVALGRSYVLHHVFNPSLMVGIKSMLIYFPICFIIEEVVFRGLLDSHVHNPGEPKGILSAIYVSALWGLWHLPVVAPNSVGHLLGATVSIIVVHTIIGVPLSIFWRKSGNLAVTSFTHALIDSVRNALLSGI